MSTNNPLPLNQPQSEAASVAAENLSAGDGSAAFSIDPLTEMTVEESEKERPERTWLQAALILLVSIGIFAMSGMLENGPLDLVLLIGVLLFHELGHYAGMRWFNYQDVRMFFIPFFGAAVAGRTRSVEGYKEAIVLLLGPLPGIVLGGLLGIAAIRLSSEALRSAALMLIFLNGFNLLPFMPLDGGRVLHLVLFSRQYHLEAAFRVLTGGVLVLVSLALQAWLLAFVGAMIIFGTLHTFKISRLASLLRGPLQTGGTMDLSERIPRELAVPLIEQVQALFPEMRQPKALANAVRQVWERVHLRPPGLAASLGILVVHGGGMLAAVILALLLIVAGPGQPPVEPVPGPEANGKLLPE